MELRNQLLSLVLTSLFLTGGALSAAENLVTNGGFEAEEELVFTGGRRAGPAGQWTVRMWGDWVGKVAKSDIVSYSTDARTGRRALSIDTTALNPSGKITDDFRSPRNPKYTIFVTRKIEGIKPDSWYLAKFRIKSAGIAVDEGLEYIADLQPWPLTTFGPQAKARPLWKMIHAWERRLFLPQYPIADGSYHEYVWLKQTYKENDSIEIGIRIRAPWTGTIILDDVEIRQVDPDEDMTAMEKFLAMRATKPLREVRTLNRETTLVSDGRATGAILIPDDPAYAPLGRRIASRIKKLTGANLPVVTKLADVPEGAQIVAVGSMMKNELVGRLHFNRYVEIDALSPGPGGYIVWTVAEPYGLAKKQNVIVVGGSDLTGEKAAVDDFCGMLTAEGNTIRLPLLHKVFPKKTIPEDEREVPRNSWGFKWDRNRFSGFAKWYLSRWLETGDLEVARLARDEIIKVADAYLENPYFQTQWCSYEVGWAWDAMEEVPVFSDADRLKISNILLGYMHMRTQAGTSGWSRMEPRLAKDGPTWNHQAKGLVGAYTTARYFNRYYGDQDWRYRNYLATAANCFGEQAKYSKPQENSANYWLITMRFSLAYYLGEWDKTFFANDAMRRYAEYFAMICDNKGGISGFGDAYYCYTGWKGGVGTKDWAVPLGFWWYKDGRMLWWTKHVLADYKNPYHQDVEPVEWKELVGVKKIPLEEGVYVPAGTSARWSAGSGKGAETAGKVSFAESFDKITFRENWDYEGQYMSLEGITRGIHSGVGINQICKLSLLGEDLLIGSTYKGNNVRTNCSIVVVKDAGIDDEAAKGKGRFAFQWWAPLAQASPGYAALKTLTDLPRT